jgi:ribosomal protein S12 methylthiotransferase
MILTAAKRNQKKDKVRVGMLSLGCPKTLVDSEVALGILKNADYEIAETVTECDVALVNTCAFINEAREESIDKIVNLAELKNNGRIQKLVVMGCLAQQYFRDLKKDIPEMSKGTAKSLV